MKIFEMNLLDLIWYLFPKWQIFKNHLEIKNIYIYEPIWLKFYVYEDYLETKVRSLIKHKILQTFSNNFIFWIPYMFLYFPT